MHAALSAMKRVKNRLSPSAVILLASVYCGAIPFLLVGIRGGHDFAFHTDTWLDFAAHHSILPLWSVGASRGFGDARFIFYPPVSWLIGGNLCKILPAPVVPGIFVLLCLSIAGVSMY